jgi:hypothetical protein
MSDERASKQSSGTDEETADALREHMELLQAKLNAAKIAFHNRTELDGKIPEYADVGAVAKELIATNYRLQKLLYGEVKMRLSVAKLIRASSR